MISQADFEKINHEANRDNSLDSWAKTSEEQIAQGHDVPDGGPWTDSTGKSISAFPFGPGRALVRNYCMWIEFTLPDGSKGIQISAHATNADRFL